MMQTPIHEYRQYARLGRSDNSILVVRCQKRRTPFGDFKTGEPTTCNFQNAGWLTEANHLRNVADRAGQKIDWDSAKLQATNTRRADPFIRRVYRKGWKLA